MKGKRQWQKNVVAAKVVLKKAVLKKAVVKKGSSVIYDKFYKNRLIINAGARCA
jgi:hypothetical protein